MAENLPTSANTINQTVCDSGSDSAGASSGAVAQGHAMLPRMLGSYEVIESIGQGGMGMVLKCRDNSLKREVAIKVLRAESCNDTVARMRFIKEAQITGQLEHPGIVSVHLLGWDGDDHEFFSMKLVSGRPLHKVLELWHADDKKTRTDLPLARLISVFERVCETIGFAHSRGVIHRDLKPSNVMIGKHGEVWVLDWGLAKLLHEPESEEPAGKRMGSGVMPADLGNYATLDGTVVGTPPYMAPEQASGKPLDEGVDIFGLGALLYEMLTGQPPHSGKSLREVLARAAKGRVTPVNRTLRGRRAPRALAAMAYKCLAARREERYATVDELLRDVRAYATGERVSALPDTALDVALRFMRRHGRAVMAGTAAAAVLVITLSVSAVLVASKGREARDAEAAQQKERAARLEAELLVASKDGEARDAEAARQKERGARLEAELEKQKTLAATAESAHKRLAAFDPYSQAMDLLMRGQLPERAAELLKNALVIDASFPEAQFALGEALRACGRPLDAAAAYAKADDLSRAIAGRPDLHAMVAAGFALDGAGRLAEAEDAFARAEKEGANDPLALVGRVFRLAHDQKLSEARQVAEETLKRAPHLWETHFAVGYALAESINNGLIPPAEWSQPAVAALRKALELSPRQAEIYVWLAITLSHMGSADAHAEALACGERAIALEPLNGNRYITRAGYRLSSGDLKGAKQDMATAQRLGVAPVLLQAFDARCAAARGDDEETFRLLSEVLHTTREWPAYVANWAIVGINLRKFDEVRPVVERLAAQHPHFPYVFLLRGSLKAAEGNIAAAVMEAREGLKVAPYHIALHKALANWLHDGRQYKDSLEAADKALELAGADYSMKMIRMDCLLKLGRANDARDYLKTLQKEYPNQAQELNRIYEKLEADAGK